jgi:hypothetical protein
VIQVFDELEGFPPKSLGRFGHRHPPTVSMHRRFEGSRKLDRELDQLRGVGSGRSGGKWVEGAATEHAQKWWQIGAVWPWVPFAEHPRFGHCAGAAE